MPDHIHVITTEYTVECSLGGYFDDSYELETEEAARQYAKARLIEELTELVLKRPDELETFFDITLVNTQKVRLDA